MARARYIRESVVSGFAGPLDQWFDWLIEEFAETVKRWLPDRKKDECWLARALSGTPTALEKHVTYEVVNRDSRPRIDIVVGASTAPDGDITIQIHGNVNRFGTQYPRNPNRDAKVSVLHHCERLRKHLTHELAHREMWVKSKAVDPAKLPIRNATHPLFYNMPFSMFRHLMRTQRNDDDGGRQEGEQPPNLRFAKSLMKGRETTTEQWYRGQPEELMSFAIELGDLITSPAPDILFRNLLINELVDEMSKHLPKSPRHKSRAWRRFVKFVCMSLVTHRGYEYEQTAQKVHAALKGEGYLTM